MRMYRRTVATSDVIRPARIVSGLQKPNTATPNYKYLSQFYGYAVFGRILVLVDKEYVICSPLGIRTEYPMGEGLG